MATTIARIAMYQKIQDLLKAGFSIAQIARQLSLSRPTIYKYLSLDETSFVAWSQSSKRRCLRLAPYEQQVRSRLEKYPDLSAAQIEDWLKADPKRELGLGSEVHPEVKVSTRTVVNFVRQVRKHYRIEKRPSKMRHYQPVPELPMGKQLQIDFGRAVQEDGQGRKVWVYFMGAVLARSRHRFVYFEETPFTTLTTIEAHEAAFAYYGGIPEEIVYDQDRLMVIEENRGDIRFTEGFTRYMQQRKFKVHLCRAADPESKGKVERVVGYVKNHFLKGRVYENIQVLKWT